MLGRQPSRRDLLKTCGMGFGATAFSALQNSWAGSAQAGSMGLPHLPPKARNVIFLFMEGGVSQIDSFDPKPLLEKYDGKPFPAKMEKTQFNKNGNTMAALWPFRNYGKSGTPVSDLFPYIGSQIDEIALIRSVVSDSPEHTNANYMLHTGNSRQGFPSAGSWINYGLGSVNDNLPGYVVLESNTFMPPGGPDNFGAGFLPSSYQGSIFRAHDLPVANVRPRESSPALQRNKLDLVKQLDLLAQGRDGQERQIESAIANFELAFRMQSAAPELMDVSKESELTKRLYGIDSSHKRTGLFGKQCLLARRMIERGVRFVELLMPDGARWDQHGKMRKEHKDNALTVDQPIAGLIMDLKQRGLLDETLVVFATEFGRTPFSQGKDGRDHNEYGFTLWMAGGGVKGGTVYGKTDEFGYKVVENPVTIHDFHATILHLLGLDHKRLTYRFSGRDFRLTDVHGHVVTDILS